MTGRSGSGAACQIFEKRSFALEILISQCNKERMTGEAEKEYVAAIGMNFRFRHSEPFNHNIP